jgi:hypothetical protein
LNYLPGTIFDNDGNAGFTAVETQSVAAGYLLFDDSLPASTVVPTTAMTAIQWASLKTPTVLPISSTSNNVQVRTFAYAIQLVFRGKLLETEGAVQFIEQFEFGVSHVTGTVSFASLRTDPSYRKKYFADGSRVIQFNWSPNCESVRYARVVHTATPSLVHAAPRMLIRIVGVETGQSVEVRVMGFQELTWNVLQGQTSDTHVSPDAVHVMNAIVSGRGRFNEKGPRGHLHKEALAHKLLSAPSTAKHINANLAAGGSLLDTAREAAHRGLKAAGGRALRAILTGLVG